MSSRHPVLARRRWRRRTASASGRSAWSRRGGLGVGDRGARGVGHRQVEHRRPAAAPGRARTAPAGRGRGQPGRRRRWPARPAAPAPRGSSAPGPAPRQGAGGVADGQVELPGDRAQVALDRRGRPAARRQVERRPGTPRGPSASGTSASRSPTTAWPDSSAAAASPGTGGRPRVSPGTGSTSRSRCSPSPRSAVSAQPSGTASSVPGSPPTRWAVSPSRASSAAS